MMAKKWVYFFGDGKADGKGDMKDLLGGKGAGLAEMTRLRIPVPAGFTMAAADVRHTPSELKPVDTMMYSDGLAAFSVFVEDMPPAGAASMVSRKGATVAVTQVLESGPQVERHLITLVGELPTPTAQRIAQSIHRMRPE